MLLKIQRETSRLCPRVILEDGLEPAAKLAHYACKIGLDSGAFRMIFDTVTAGMDHEERESTLDAVISAVASDGISARLAAERSAREAAAEAKAKAKSARRR